MAQFDGKTLVIIALVAFIAWFMFSPQGSTFVLEDAPVGIENVTDSLKNSARSDADVSLSLIHI